MKLEHLKFNICPLNVQKRQDGLSIKRQGALGPALHLDKFESLIFNMISKGESLSVIIPTLYHFPGYYKFEKLYIFLLRLSINKIILNSELKELIEEAYELPKLSFWLGPSYFNYLFLRYKKKWLSKMPRTHIDEILGNDGKSFTERFKELPFIRKFPESILNKLVQHARKKAIAKGKVLIREGDISRDLYIVIDGEFGVFIDKNEKQLRNKVATLRRGAIFGEVGFFLSEKRSGSVVALTDGKVVEIPLIPQLVRKNMNEKIIKSFQQRIRYLQVIISSSFFARLPGESIDLFVELGKIKEISIGKNIINEGEPANSMFVIIRGRVSVFQNDVQINHLTEGAVIGEIAVLMAGVKRTSTVVASSDLTVCEVTFNDLWQCFSENLFLAIKFESLARRRIIKDRARARQG